VTGEEVELKLKRVQEMVDIAVKSGYELPASGKWLA